MNKQAFIAAIRLIGNIDREINLDRYDLDESERSILDLARREGVFYGVKGLKLKDAGRQVPPRPVRESGRKAQRV